MPTPPGPAGGGQSHNHNYQSCRPPRWAGQANPNPRANVISFHGVGLKAEAFGYLETVRSEPGFWVLAQQESVWLNGEQI
jgi:hypothetical protein